MSVLNIFSALKSVLTPTEYCLKECVRFASKKARASTSNTSTTVRPKHRGIKKQDGFHVTRGTILATQRFLRWLPGLNVGIGCNGTLFAIQPGYVVITCEKFDARWSHKWVQERYGGRENQTIYKKYFNIIPDPQHTQFKLIDKI